ncbi:unnamed protein product [Cyprideis torosa]|uniref:DNA replication factor RFC1 C-terminal domain-containing protein n=1 Tax=Cyprideis torosa TaxID=163714 RepID=A0A7R8WQV9_9CRUS|nr:unnamed protein product [Cyprideis torosa]CAG0903126.1 unnamed protein product [Cyprideis torosa]
MSQNLKSMSFEELLELKQRIGSKLYSEAMRQERGEKIAHRVAVPKRANKNRPREVSARRPPGPREVVAVSSKAKHRDPRFDPLCGDYKPELWKKSYSFIEDMRKEELETVKNQMKDETDEEKRERMKDLVKRMQNQANAREVEEAREERKKKAKQEAIEALKQGRKPFFKSDAHLRKEELEEKYKKLKSSGELKKFLEKKKKRLASSERKAKPNQFGPNFVVIGYSERMDIRNFFNKKGAPSKASSSGAAAKKRTSKWFDDSSDEEGDFKGPSNKKEKKESGSSRKDKAVKEVSASDFFGNRAAKRSSTPPSAKSVPSSSTSTPPKKKHASPPRRTSPRKKKESPVPKKESSPPRSRKATSSPSPSKTKTKPPAPNKGAMMTICSKYERMNMQHVKPDMIREIVSGAQHDVRQTLHHLSLWVGSAAAQASESVGKLPPTREEVKREAERSHRDVTLGPFETVRRVFSAEYLQGKSLNEKAALFFHDYSMGPLFVHENYLNARPKVKGKAKEMKLLSLAADSLCMGDLIEKEIRSSQSWSLLPVEAIFASVLPGEHLQGQLDRPSFPSWLGKNSSQKKCDRLLQEIQTHLRLRVSGSKNEVLMDYVQAIRDKIYGPLVQKANDEGVKEAVDVMEEYSLLREDLEGIVELSVWPGLRPDPSKAVPTAIKSAFTRRYNKYVKPTAFSADAHAAKKKRGVGAGLVEEDEEDADEEEEGKDEGLEGNALIKKKEVKGSRAASTSSSSAGSSRGGKGSRGRGKK